MEFKDYSSQASDIQPDLGIAHLLVSCFGNKDSDGDVMVKGAFAKAIADGKQVGKLPPGVQGHDWLAPVAKTKDAYEDDEGLHVIAQFNLETQRGRESFSDIKAGIITEYSFGFKTRDSEQKDGARHILDVDWLEWSPVLVGANRATRTLGVKDAKPEQPAPEAETRTAAGVLADWKDGLRIAHGLDRGLSLEAHYDGVLAVVADFKDRFADLAELKQGRMLSETNHQRLGSIRDGLRSHADAIDTMLDSNRQEAIRLERQIPPEKSATAPDAVNAYARFQATLASLNGATS